MEEKYYLCIDLKSFYASVEAVERGLDPFKTNLIVADPSRGNGAICLAITPALKALGIKNRCRVFEIPKNIEYITALPRMKLYMEYSANIYAIYLKYISKEDIHPYSIDECFFDITSYLTLYKKTPNEIAKMLMDAVFKETGVCASAGIGTNLFLAKAALDITAKHADDHIGYLDIDEFKKTVWFHRPITDVWNVGRGIAKRLEKYQIFDLRGVAMIDPKLMYKEFGVNAEYLIDHANGIEPCTIKEIQEFVPETSSISNGQILFDDYNYDDALLALKEMVDVLALDLVDNDLVTNSISLRVGYSKEAIKSTGGTMKLSEYTNSSRKLVDYFTRYFHKTANPNFPIRKLNIGFNHLTQLDYVNLDFFSDYEKDEKELKVQKAMMDIKNKFGKNSILRGMSLMENATTKKRNKLIGGHNGE